MKILWKYLRPHSRLIFLALLFAATAQLLSLIDPIIFGKIIDEYANDQTNKPDKELVNGALYWLMIALGVGIIARLARSVQEYVMRLAVQKFGMQIFNDGLRQILRLSYQEYEEQRSGETLAILQKVRTDTEKFISSFINVLFSSLVGFAFLIWYAITKHWALIPVFFIGFIVLGSITVLLSKKIKTIQRQINRRTTQMSGLITESLRNIELVKSLGLTFPEVRRMKVHTQKIFDLEMAKVKQVRFLTFYQDTALILLRHSVLFTLLWLIFRDVLSPGEMIAMQFISTIIFAPLQELGNILVFYRETESSLHLFDNLMQKPVEKRPEDAIKVSELTELSFDNVIFRHKTAQQNSVDGISFKVKTGETIAFVGPSGSGKSTMVKLLVGLYQPVEGTIFFNDVDSRKLRYNAMRRQVGFVTQDTQLFAGTIKENLLYVKPDATDDEIMEALHKASCDQMLARSEKGIHTKLGEGGLKISGGEKQRISIARALIRRPQLMIFDEATSALDSLTEEVITDTIREISGRKEQITILIAHRLSTILHADRIIVLEKGKIAESGSHDELVTAKGLYYAMWRQQIGERQIV
ncbi:MAG: ABC transporter ATP-binding protein [Saprospiraceae bacterium]|nr:ABC transporter ATP-binding protein [Saprospiraceae bacterium]